MMAGLITILAFVGFLGVCVYAYGPWWKQTFDDASRLPLDEDDGELRQ